MDDPPRNGRFLARRHAAALVAKGHTVDEIATCFGLPSTVVAAYLLVDRS